MRTLYDTIKGCKTQADLHKHDILCFDDVFDNYGAKEGIRITNFINQCYNIDSEYQIYCKDWRTFLIFRARECGIAQEIINEITDLVGVKAKELVIAIDGYLELQSDEDFSLLVSKRTLHGNMMQRMMVCEAEVTDLKIINEITNKTAEDIKNIEETIRGRQQSLANGKATQHLSAARTKLGIANFVKHGNGISSEN